MAEKTNTHNYISDELKRIRELKEEQYGPFDQNMILLGQIWSALLGLKEPIPGHKVCLMYAAAKLMRATQSYRQDTYDDALNYLCQAKQMHTPTSVSWINGYKKWKKKKIDLLDD